MRVWDCLLLDDELRLLDVRLRELAGVVDAHVIVEATHTHQHAKRELTVETAEAAHLFDAYPIHWAVVDLADFGHLPPDAFPDQHRERHQRDAMAAAVVQAGGEPGDLVCYSDVDEIPRRAVIEALAVTPPDFAFTLSMRMHPMTLDWMLGRPWPGTTVSRLGDSLPQELRDRRGEFPQVIDAGWHLSWQGGPAAMVRKQERFSHSELSAGRDLAWAGGLRASGVDSNGEQLLRVDADHLDWPGGLDPTDSYWRLP